MQAYREHAPPPPLAPLVACTWELDSPDSGERLVIPDACVDLIWVHDRELIVAGPDTGPRTATLRAGTRTSGIRLRPGAGGAVLGLPASELRDESPAAEAIWGPAARRLADELAAAAPAERTALLSAAVAERRPEPDRLVIEAARLLRAPRSRVADVAEGLGVSERQLHRRTTAAVGYRPKLLARVVRLRALRLLPDMPLVERALGAGYADQAHMNEEVRRLTGLTPVRFLKDWGAAAA